MTSHVRWHIENEIIYLAYRGDTTLDDVQQSAHMLHTLIEDTDRQLVHVLVDLTQVGSYPNNIASLKRASASALAHPRLGWMIFYGIENQLLQFVVSTLTQMFSLRSQIVSTEDEAIGLLQQVDSTLPSIPAVERPA